MSEEQAGILNADTANAALTDVSTLGFLIANPQEGPFHLEVEWISSGPLELSLTGKTRSVEDFAKSESETTAPSYFAFLVSFLL